MWPRALVIAAAVGVKGARRVASPLVVLVAAVQLGACVEQAPSSASPPLNPVPTAGAFQFPAQDWLELGPHGVGNLGCNTGEFAWTTGTQPITKTSVSDVVEMSSRTNAQPKVVASANHGGTLTDAVPISGSWLVYLEYQQQGQSQFANFWYLDAVNWTTGSVVELARATSGIGLTELPWYDAGDGHAVWNQLDASGKEVLRLYDFTTGQSSTLSLPSGMSPFEPAVSGSAVVFVDNSTDPSRTREDFLGRRGSLRRYDLLTNQVSTLDADPTAFMPRVNNGEVVWTDIAATSAATVAAIPLSGGKVSNIGGSQPVTPQTNGSIVIWYDSATMHFMAFGLKTGRVAQLQVGTWADVQSVFALCGNQLFFALPPASDGGNSTIRLVDLGSLAIS
jgi:hypothetical protein